MIFFQTISSFVALLYPCAENQRTSAHKGPITRIIIKEQLTSRKTFTLWLGAHYTNMD